MSFVSGHTILLRKQPELQLDRKIPLRFRQFQPLQSLTFSPILPSQFLTRSYSACKLVNSLHPRNNSEGQRPLNPIFELAIPFAFSLVLLCLRLVNSVILPDFPRRWHNLVASSEVAESRVRAYPAHLWQAIVAYEDRRFFHHFGIDPFGLARAVLSLSARGGGSTITQQLVKNTFLKNERKLSRKIVEMGLTLALERTLSKWQILSSYMSEIYWGHGIYGVESASMFYFGKHPSLLSLGESALLAGMIPAPELRSPIRDSRRGITFQVRVLKRMVEVGFVDADTALYIVNQPLHLSVEGSKYADGSMTLFCSFEKEIRRFGKKKQEVKSRTMNSIWDWEKESEIWEVREDLEKWASKYQCMKQWDINIRPDLFFR